MLTKNRREYLTDYQKKLRKKRKRVEISLDLLQYQELQVLAQKHNCNIGPYIRDAALAYSNEEFLVPDPDQVHRLEVGLRKIGTNINQIAKRGHREGLTAPDMEKVYGFLDEIEALVAATLRTPPLREN